MSSRRAANSASLLSPCRICSSLHLRNDAPIFILVLFLARSSSFFLHCFSSKDFFFLLFEIGNGGANRGIGIFPPCCPSAIVCSLSLMPSDQVRARATGGRGPASSVFTIMIDTSQTLPLALLAIVYSEAVESCKPHYGH